MTLTSPSKIIIGRNTTDSDVTHVLGPTFESYSILGPETGDWTVTLYGADVPPEGEEVFVSVTTIPNNPVTIQHSFQLFNEIREAA